MEDQKNKEAILWGIVTRLETSLDNAGITEMTWELIDRMKEILRED